jgi:hypothetical protein
VKSFVGYVEVLWGALTYLACIVEKGGGRGGRVILQGDAGLKARLVEEHDDVI